MSEQAHKLDAEQAQQVLLQDVYIPAFVEKCAEAGLTLDQGSLGDALETVAMLKQASTTNTGGLTKAAATDLRDAMGLPQPEQLEKEAQQRARTAEVAKHDRIAAALSALSAPQQ